MENGDAEAEEEDVGVEVWNVGKNPKSNSNDNRKGRRRSK